MATLGVHTYEQATSVSTPNVAKVGIPFVVGTAPVHTAAKPAKANVPVLATSWEEAVEKLGFSYDWKKYTLCEFMYSHFQLFGCQPVIFCNVLDPAEMKESVEPSAYLVTGRQAVLPLEALAASLTVAVKGTGEDGSDAALKAGEDYSAFYGRDDSDAYVCVLELLEDGAAYDAASLTIGYDAVTPESVTVADVAEGVGQVDAVMTAVGVVPDLICAPGWSHDTVVAAVMDTKAGAISGLFKGKALIDADCGTNGVREYSELSGYKNKNSLVDEDQILCWPQVRLGKYQFHLSTQLAGLMASVDAANRGVPYESPSTRTSKWTPASWRMGRRST